MELSLFLAKVIGLVLMVVAMALLVNRKNIDLLFSTYSHPEAVFLTGMLEIALGTMMTISHTIWLWNFQGVLTFIGWMLLVRGLGRVFFPQKVTVWVEKFKKMKTAVVPLLIVVFLVGAYLAYMGFTR